MANVKVAGRGRPAVPRVRAKKKRNRPSDVATDGGGAVMAAAQFAETLSRTTHTDTHNRERKKEKRPKKNDTLRRHTHDGCAKRFTTAPATTATASDATAVTSAPPPLAKKRQIAKIILKNHLSSATPQNCRATDTILLTH